MSVKIKDILDAASSRASFAKIQSLIARFESESEEKKTYPIDFMDESDRTLLHYASASGNLDLARFCVERGGATNTRDEGGWTPLMSCASAGFVNLAKLLIHKEADAGARNEQNKNALHYAASKGHVAVLEVLLDAAAVGVDEADVLGETPLHLAAIQGRVEAVKVLVERGGANIAARNAAGDTALHLAVDADEVEIVRILLVHDSGLRALEIKNKEGKTPLNVVHSSAVFHTLKEHIDGDDD